MIVRELKLKLNKKQENQFDQYLWHLTGLYNIEEDYYRDYIEECKKVHNEIFTGKYLFEIFDYKEKQSNYGDFIRKNIENE